MHREHVAMDRSVRNASPSSSRAGVLVKSVGPSLTLAVAVALVGLERFGLRVPNPVLIFALVIVTASYVGGVWAGLASAAITFCFTVVYWSMPGRLLHYSYESAQRLLVEALTMPAMAVLVGGLKRRSSQRLAELERAVAEVRLLSGLLHVCAWCRRVRDDGGQWEKLELYVSRHTDATFTHGLCPDCFSRKYPEAK